MRNYELTVLIPSDVADDEVSGVLDTIKGWVSEQAGTVVEVNIWGRRRLAYSIADYTEGTYVLLIVTLDTEKINEVDRNLKLSQQIIRHLFVRVD